MYEFTEGEVPRSDNVIYVSSTMDCMGAKNDIIKVR